MSNARLIFGVLVFTFFISVLLGEITNSSWQLLSPVTLTIISIPLIAVISASNTPVVKGAAMAVLFGAITGFIILSDIPFYIFGIIIVPMFVAVGLAMAEVGQG